MNTIHKLFQQFLNQAQSTYGLNSPQYQELVKEQQEAMAVLEKASEEEQKEYLRLIGKLSSLLEKNPNLSAPEQQKLTTLSQKADNFTEKLKIKQGKTQQQQKTNWMLWVGGGLVGLGLIGLVIYLLTRKEKNK